MQFLEKISIEQVASEWLQAEWYKSYFDDVREKYAEVITPDITNKRENDIRKEILFSVRHDVVAPLYHLGCTWKKVLLDKDDMLHLFTIPASDWYAITGKTFQLKNIPENLAYDVGHKTNIKKKLTLLNKGEKLKNGIILVGSSEKDLTIIEGNHRMASFMLYLTQNNKLPYEQEVIVGLTPQIEKYRWSIKWEKIATFLQLCQDEEKSFYL